MFRRILYAFLGLLLCGCSGRETRHVLVVHSYDPEYPGYEKINRLLEQHFREERLSVEPRYFYLDCENYDEPGEIDRLRGLLDTLSRHGRIPDLILVDDDQATYSLLRTRHPMLESVPTVFAGVNHPDWEMIRRYALVTGFHDKIHLPENLRMIRELTGNTSVYSIIDRTAIDRLTRAEIDRQLLEPEFVNNLDWHVRTMPLQPPSKESMMFSAFSIRDLSSNLGNSPQGGLNFFWIIGRYGSLTYLQTKYDLVTSSMSMFFKQKQFTVINEQFDCPGSTLLGGYLTPAEVQVSEQAGAAARLLRGEPVSAIPVRESAKGYYVDWKVMERTGIPRSAIPAGCTILNMPFSVRHPLLWWVLVAGGSLAVAALLGRVTFLYIRETRRRRRTLCDLEREKEALALAIEGGGTFAWQFRQGCVIFEPAFWSSFHLRPRSLGIAEFLCFVHPDTLRAAENMIQESLTCGKRSVTLLCDFDGTGYRWWEMRCSTIESLTGEMRTSGLLLDIDEFKLRERELIEAREMAEQAELKESFLANMSHEIRTPLNAIVGFSNLLVSEEGLAEEDREMFVQTINHNSEQLLKLVGDILDIARIESGYMSFDCRPCDVATLLREVWSTYRIFIPSTVEFPLCEDADCRIVVDRGRLEQVLTNLLSNAVKFTPNGRITLGWRLAAANGEVELFVEDTGIGIPASEQSVIFSRFYKKNEFMQGTGLGLAICKVIVDRLRGRLTLYSVPGSGSRFSVFLPVARPEETPTEA